MRVVFNNLRVIKKLIMKKVILCGGGHGHVMVIKKIIELRNRNIKELSQINFILISDNEKQYYSGMLPGFIEGIYEKEEIAFNLPDLCKKANVEFILDSLVEVDNTKKEIVTTKGKYSYDYISLNLGAVTRRDFKIENMKNETYTKPIEELVEFIESIKLEKEDKKELIIIGGGPSGVELSLALKNRFSNLNITIVQSSKELIPNFNEGSKKIIYKLLQRKGINYKLNHHVSDIKDLNYDYLIISNGYKGPDVKFIGFEKDSDNFLISDNRLFVSENALAMGDMVKINENKDLPRAGVFAIRQAPILCNNLINLIKGNNALKEYKPQKNYLQILNTGGKKALLNKGKYSFNNILAFTIKDYIDRNYMRLK